jgi:ABC-type multidrug transport system fused ATPase/permease subunit
MPIGLLREPASSETVVSTLRKPASGAAPGLVWEIARRYWLRLLLTYSLFTVENGLMLLQPVCLGKAIDSLLAGRSGGWWLLMAAYLGYSLTAAIRRAFDTRSFMAIHFDLVTHMVNRQRTQRVAVSRVAARSALARSLVDFFETDLPQVMNAAYSLIGAVVVLAFYDRTVAMACLAVMVPCSAVNLWCQRRLTRHNQRLHDQMEREIDVISGNRMSEIRDHFRKLAGSTIRISDYDAVRVGVAQLVLAGLVGGALLHLSSFQGTTSGDIYAALRYVLLFVIGVDGVPVFLRQFARLQDIASRVQHAPPHEIRENFGNSLKSMSVSPNLGNP